MQLARRRRTLAQELVGADPGSSFRTKRTTATHWELVWHAHPELELTWIEAGAGMRHVGDHVAPFSSGDLVLLGPHLPHTWTSEPVPGRRAVATVVQFPPALVAGLEGRALQALVQRAARGLEITGATADVVRAELAALTAAPPGLERLGRLLAVLGLIARAPASEIHPLAADAPLAPTAASPRASGRWAAVLRDLHTGAGDTLPLAALAARHGLSPSSFARGFRRHFQITCGAYLARLRLAQVARELAAGDRPIAALAFTAGFGTLSAFNRRFRAEYGMTPREFRARHGASP